MIRTTIIAALTLAAMTAEASAQSRQIVAGLGGSSAAQYLAMAGPPKV